MAAKTTSVGMLLLVLAAAIVLGAAPASALDLPFTETWAAENIGDTADASGPGDGGLTNWQQTTDYGTAAGSNAYISTNGLTKYLVMDAPNTGTADAMAVGVWTKEAVADGDLLEILDIEADLFMLSAADAGQAYLTVTDITTPLTGYALAIDPIDTDFFDLSIQKYVKNYPMDRVPHVDDTVTVGGANIFSWASMTSVRMVGTMLSASELQIEAYVNGSLVNTWIDTSPLAFTGGVRFGMFADEGRGAAVSSFGAITETTGPPPIPGDINGDGVVDVGDLAILSIQWDTAGSPPFNADINGSGLVDVGDLAILSLNWNAGGGGSGASSVGLDGGVVPLPSALACGLGALGGLLLRRRR